MDETNEQLVLRAQQGSREAAEELIVRFDNMAWKRALTYKVLLAKRQGCGIDIEDIAQEGRIGIWRAIHKYSPQRGGSFCKVAYMWIWAATNRVAQNLNYAKRANGCKPISAKLADMLVYERSEEANMTVKQLKKLLREFPDDQEVILLDSSRIGHDDAVLGFSIQKGFLDPENDEDVRFEETTEDSVSFNVPCCVLSF